MPEDDIVIAVDESRGVDNSVITIRRGGAIVYSGPWEDTNQIVTSGLNLKTHDQRCIRNHRAGGEWICVVGCPVYSASRSDVQS